jgi:hypothetical protein
VLECPQRIRSKRAPKLFSYNPLKGRRDSGSSRRRQLDVCGRKELTILTNAIDDDDEDDDDAAGSDNDVRGLILCRGTSS